MKTFKNIFTILFLALITVACNNKVEPEVKVVETIAKAEMNSLNPNATFAKAEFGIEGMTCAMGCAKTIEKKIARMEGVKSATVDFDKRLAMVEYDEAIVTPVSLEATVNRAGEVYVVKDMKTVESFSTEKEMNSDTHECKADCKMACCADKNKTDEAMTDKKVCAEDCKKDCCIKKQKT